MAKDSKLWEQAYESYKERFPKSKYNSSRVKIKQKPTLPKEPMQLLEDYRNVTKELQAISRKKKALALQLKKAGIDPVNYTRSNYFEHPILLYVLKLEHNCWYIGMSRNVDRRYKFHMNGKTMWTSEHKPLSIHEVRETGLDSDSEAARLEDELTLEYARQYGVDKVRGGGYCQRKPIWPANISEPDLNWITA